MSLTYAWAPGGAFGHTAASWAVSSDRFMVVVSFRMFDRLVEDRGACRHQVWRQRVRGQSFDGQRRHYGDGLQATVVDRRLDPGGGGQMQRLGPLLQRGAQHGAPRVVWPPCQLQGVVEGPHSWDSGDADDD